MLPFTPLRHVVAAGAFAAVFSLRFKNEPFSLAAPLPKNASIFGNPFCATSPSVGRGYFIGAAHAAFI